MGERAREHERVILPEISISWLLWSSTKKLDDEKYDQDSYTYVHAVTMDDDAC